MSSKTFQEEKHGAISQFLDQTVGELRHYLSVRGLTTTGTKLDLAVRALIAQEQGVSPKDALEEKTKGLQSCYDQLLKTLDIDDPLQLQNCEWKSDVSLWPLVHLGTIFQFIIDQKSFETDYVGQYKTKKAYSYFMSGFVQTLLVKQNEDRVIIKGTVYPSQKIREQPKVIWVVCECQSGKVLGAYCSCTAGFSQCCNHVIAVLYKIEYANTNEMINPACTSVSCGWNSGSGIAGRDIESSKLKDMNIRQHDLANPTPKFCLQSEMKEDFDPRANISRGNESERAQALYKNVLDVWGFLSISPS